MRESPSDEPTPRGSYLKESIMTKHKYSKAPEFRYLIARNKITHLVDVIDTKTAKVVSRDHRNHNEAEAAAAKLLNEPA